MSALAADMLLAAPELFLLAAGCLTLMAATPPTPAYRELPRLLAVATTAILLILLLALHPKETHYAFHGGFVSDLTSTLLKFCMALAALCAFGYSGEYLKEHDLNQREHYVLGLFALLGGLVLASARSFLTLYLGLELLSLSLYAMIAIHRNSATGVEAAMKYFVLGALASGMLLYGISMLYGATGELQLDRVAAAIGASDSPSLIHFGLSFIVVGIAFKLGVAPFHMWVPDVYQGAPTPVTLFVASMPKLAAFALAARVLFDGLAGAVEQWAGMLALLALLSMAIGNVVAIAQSNIKRMLGYSTVAHMGFLLLGLLAARPEGLAGAMFYAIAYTLMSLGAFGLITLMSRDGAEIEELSDLAGLAAQRPWQALIMMVLMFSMAGVPPFVGFWAKWFVIREAIDAGYVWLAVAAVVCAIIGAYYYLRIIRLMYFEPPAKLFRPELPPGPRVAIGANGLAILALGLFPSALMALCLQAMAP
ncbi:MAG: NADH-quinone oxidoreductase subunit NuoN [Gammaproteobacteria bacterium]|nr:NADH-quinone oxidoreductase subunit NuoN [Gammaproteobacteria bacterium]MDD9823876.1 NADH-quinone oxidoreductase subunit NuoN [Gammaproteobacteria bacterium]MDD9863232.1 NADH-quinone oxidoreductase subunit NuoN [Gammaproteobacteria bacterium]